MKRKNFEQAEAFEKICASVEIFLFHKENMLNEKVSFFLLQQTTTSQSEYSIKFLFRENEKKIIFFTEFSSSIKIIRKVFMCLA